VNIFYVLTSDERGFRPLNPRLLNNLNGGHGLLLPPVSGTARPLFRRADIAAPVGVRARLVDVMISGSLLS
jgi:hypothetical protein